MVESYRRHLQNKHLTAIEEVSFTSLLEGLLGSSELPALDWVQVEPSTYCNAECVYCPQAVYGGAWERRHLPLTTFERLLLFLKRTELVFLQGWGEPFLNPDFFEMIRVAKQAGHKVGTATNGMLLDVEAATRMVDYGVDVVAVSLAGTGERNDAVRKGTSVAQVLRSIDALNRAATAAGGTSPEIHVAYMLLRSALRDVVELPALLRGLGVSQVVISTLDLVPTKELESETVIASNMDEYSDLRRLLETVAGEGRRYGIDIHWRISKPCEANITCTENVQHAMFISADGAVSPCVFTNLPIRRGSHARRGSGRAYRKLTFGNVNLVPLESIWSDKPYTSFRRAFFEDRIPSVCKGCPKLTIGSLP